VTEASTRDRPVDGAAMRWVASVPLGSVGLGVATASLLILLRVAWEAAFGDLDSFSAARFAPWNEAGAWTSLVIAVLTGFVVGAGIHVRRATLRDVEALAPLLDCSTQEHAGFTRSILHSDPRPTWLATLAGVLVGLLVITEREGSLPFLLSNQYSHHGYLWGLLANALLFAILGREAYETFKISRVFTRIEARIKTIDLLDLRPLVPFARRGLRSAFFWLAGSSIASLIFLGQGFQWATALVLAGTLTLGTLALLLPVRGVHRRIRAAKQAELTRVRDAIRGDRDLLLRQPGDAASPAAPRLPALLAYESRIAEVNTWPFDTPTLARFGLLMAVAVGSWLGGAVVERALGLFLD
jgi:hypothetical protein